MAIDTQAPSRQVSDLLKANSTVVVWLVFLALGGGLLALYYARIRYLPDIEWSSSIIYLAAASIIGGGVGLLFALSLLLPGAIWAEFIVFDTKLFPRVFCYDDDTEPCIRAIVYYLGIPFGVILLLSHLSLISGLIAYSIIALMLLIITFYVMRRGFMCLLLTSATPVCTPSLSSLYSCIRKSLPSKNPRENRRIFKYSFWFTLSALLSQVSMLLIYRLSGQPGGLRFVILTAICTTGVLISNHVVAVRFHHSPKQAVVASFVAASLLLFAADRFSPLSLRIMAFYGFGEGQKVNLIVNDEGAGIIEKLRLPNKCIPATRERLCDVEILSKVGNEYYLSLDGRTFALPKSAVMSHDSRDPRAR